jgi:predicted GH43/DUF377 family glycosyl hydrolase
MEITPYPFSDVSHENPSFYTSQNGIDWNAPTNNPLVDHPNNGYNDDPELIIDPLTGKFYIYYNETPSDYKTQYLSLLSSTDGTNWNDHRKLIDFHITKGDPFIVSPTLVYTNGTYYMFHVEVAKGTHSPRICSKDTGANFIRVMFSDDGLTWDKKQDVGINIDFPSNFHPWHINIIPANNKFYMLVNGYYNTFCDKHNLYLAVSDDLINWHFIDKPIVKASKDLFDSKVIYRSAAVVDGDDMFVYFSFYRYDNRWMLGVKHIKISDYAN